MQIETKYEEWIVDIQKELAEAERIIRLQGSRLEHLRYKLLKEVSN